MTSVGWVRQQGPAWVTHHTLRNLCSLYLYILQYWCRMWHCDSITWRAIVSRPSHWTSLLVHLSALPTSRAPTVLWQTAIPKSVVSLVSRIYLHIQQGDTPCSLRVPNPPRLGLRPRPTPPLSKPSLTVSIITLAPSRVQYIVVRIVP